MSQPPAGRSRASQGDLLASLLSRSPLSQIVFEVDGDGELVGGIATRAAYESRLLTVTDVRGLRADSMLRAETAAALSDGYRECLRTGAACSYEEFVDIDGRETWWMTTLSPELGDDGRFSRLIATFFLVDFVRETEQALRRSEANLRALIESSPDAMLVCRADGGILFSNPTATNLLRAAGAPDGGDRNLETLIAPEERAGFLEHIGTILTRGAPEPAREVALRTQRGDPIQAEIAAMPLSFDGEPRLLLVARDVSERKQIQKQLALADRMIALGTMAAGVAHEINNPLTYVQANIAFAIEELSSEPSEALRVLREALEGTDRIRHIVLDMKALTRSSEEERGPVSVDRALDAALKMAEREISHRARLVRTEGQPPPVLANEPKLVQVFLNLILNAAHAIVTGSVETNEIVVTSGTNELGAVMVEIRDSGAGIAPEHVQRLFDPFFTTKPVGAGTGLGLSISQRVIADLGGVITFDSVLGSGSTFRVDIPAMAFPTVPANTVETPAPSRSRLLVIDDEPLVGRAVVRMLQRQHTVTFVSRAQEALDLLLGGSAFDAILCDLMMPEMTGMEFFEALTARVPDMVPRVAFMSGGAFTAAAREFLASVQTPTLEKPFGAKELGATVAQLCGTTAGGT